MLPALVSGRHIGSSAVSVSLAAGAARCSKALEALSATNATARDVESVGEHPASAWPHPVPSSGCPPHQTRHAVAGASSSGSGSGSGAMCSGAALPRPLSAFTAPGGAATAAATTTSAGPSSLHTHQHPHQRRMMSTAAVAAAAGPGTGAGLGPGGPRRLSPEADHFQRHWYGEVNSGAHTGGGAGGGGGGATTPSAEEQAAAYAKQSQAIRLLVGWLRERRAAAPPDADSGPAAGAGAGGRRTYDIDWRLAARAMQVIRDLEYARPDKRRPWQQQRQQRQQQHGGWQGGAAAATGGSGHLSLDEMIEATELLAADAPSMGFALTDRNYELMLDLYVQKAEGADGEPFRAGLAARATAAAAQMTQQLVQVTPTALGCILTCLALDSGGGGGGGGMGAKERLAAGVGLVDAHLPVLTGAAAAASAGGGGAAAALAAPRLRERLEDLMVAALEQRDWTAYAKLRSVLLSRAREPPPRRVLAAALAAAAATDDAALGAAGEAAAAAKEEEGLGEGAAAATGGGWRAPAAREQAADALELLAARHQREPAFAPPPLPPPPPPQPLGPAASAYQKRLAAARWREQAAKAAEEALLDAEEGGLVAVLRAAAAAGDDALADRAYERLRWTAARRLQVAAAAAAGDGAAAAAGAAATDAAIPPAATLAVLGLAARRGDFRRAAELVAALAELDVARKRYAGEGAPAAAQAARRAARDRAAQEAAVSAYGGLGPLSEQLIGSEAATVAYYSELLRRVADAAAGGGAAAPFGGSAVPFGPALRAAAARRDLTSVAGLIKQMRELGCAPTADSYAAVIDASYRAGKPERVPGLLALMAEEGLAASAAVWELQLRAAAEAPDGDLAAVVQRALAEAAPEREGARGVVAISGRVLAEVRAAAQVRGDGRAAALLTRLAEAQEEARRTWRQAKRAAAWEAAAERQRKTHERAERRQQRAGERAGERAPAQARE
ncbi:hypothetical protein HXX76_009520 [Chlamydomonas incerta]|uniref:Pentacotripeptide-repeat region of PRORP domain-containing protein n=1 Tax=Chlamydomonas incerta TaxID=51695 RepID=A0A835STD2_CHLIN|nr:hypothetical protein HXX76_009520 [Chlamydomonas incerta]|eukprot:KAG2431506.1 hypothetical protein HXX76_009520 [Chlamydomonas incerta]